MKSTFLAGSAFWTHTPRQGPFLVSPLKGDTFDGLFGVQAGAHLLLTTQSGCCKFLILRWLVSYEFPVRRLAKAPEHGRQLGSRLPCSMRGKATPPHSEDEFTMVE